MARILSVSCDDALLVTREMILSEHGHEVTSAYGYAAAMRHCNGDKQFDLFILGHSIPHGDKEALVQAFRANCPRSCHSVEKDRRTKSARRGI